MDGDSGEMESEDEDSGDAGDDTWQPDQSGLSRADDGEEERCDRQSDYNTRGKDNKRGI